MSDYTYTDHDGDTLRLLTSVSAHRVVLIAKGDEDCKEIHIANTDAPKVALELLKASASDWSTQPVELVAIVASLERYVKAHDPEKKLQERRDAIALELSETGHTYDTASPMTRRAIDRIIELEDGK